MKKLFLTIIFKYKLFGFYNIVEKVFYKTRNIFFRIRYKNNERFDLSYKGVNTSYSTEDAYSKHWFYPDFLDQNYYEPTVMDILIEHLDSKSCFIDIGANLGYFTCFGASICTEGQVHAFEMDINCQELIDKNIAINNFKQVFNNRNVVTDKEGFLEVARYDYPQPKLSIFNERTTQKQKVNTITLDQYIAQKNLLPTLIKIDVEGAEHKVLKGMKDTLQQSPIKLLVEVHANVLKTFGSNVHEVLNILWENDFQISEVIEHRKSNQFSTRMLSVDDTLVGNTLIIATKE